MGSLAVEDVVANPLANVEDAFAFLFAYALEGRLRETSKSEYMSVMRLFYQFNRSTEDRTLELRRDMEDGLTVKYATVGLVFSADFF